MLQNLHTHSTLCDGKNTPEEMLDAAILLGFDSLGFSPHAKTIQNANWEMSCSVEEYISRIGRLRAEYEGKIEIFIGTELDYYSKGIITAELFDYTIGAVHKTVKNGAVIDYDHAYDSSKRAIDLFYHGNSIEYARDYYEKVVQMSSEVQYNVVGHFDVLTKFSEQHPKLIDIESKAYRSIALDALHAVRKNREIFEVNTGAIGRGYRTTPYPASFILDEMKSIGCKLILTSDCHDKDYLDVHFKEAEEYVKAHGFDTLYYLTKQGFVSKKI
ncbi:MAG: histidinol-phosphatase HisJ family protein [Ruminococcaceae bacterium]|nr:histidinol-phosphatase HisJ family protein [Oscillospiraceae bacterium]